LKLERCRLPVNPEGWFNGRLIDRNRPISIRLDGRTYRALEGDSILSALLANGTDTFGQFRGSPVALDARTHPPVMPKGARGDVARALAMDRTPAVDGMDLVTLGRRHAAADEWRAPLKGAMERLTGRRVASLGLDVESISPYPGPWAEQEPDTRRAADFVVVGGGVAGMQAALEAAEAGREVLLLELRGELGGRAEFFGSQEGESRPLELVPPMIAEIHANPRIEVLLRTEVLSQSGGALRAHRILASGREPRGEVLDIQAERLILATGTHERLPLFPGNRLPGTMPVLSAFDLARDFGVWPGQSAFYAINSSPAAQVALRAAEMGISSTRLADSRIDPQSRFFEFAKAHGVSLSPGIFVRRARLTDDGERLAITTGLVLDERGRETETLEADRLVHCGGWQPNLSLWHMVGGRTVWNAELQHFAASGEIDNVRLAGSCSGPESLSACMQSGRHAAAQLLGREGSRVREARKANPAESADGPVTRAAPQADDPFCFFDSGHSFAVYPVPEREGWLARFFRRSNDASSVGIEPRALSLNDVAAKVLLGGIAPAAAGRIAQERCVLPGALGGEAVTVAKTAPDNLPLPVPAYLVSRFGMREVVIRVRAADRRVLETGCLVFGDSMTTSPLHAVGTVLGSAPHHEGETLVYVEAGHAGAGSRLVARDGTQPVDLTFQAVVS